MEKTMHPALARPMYLLMAVALLAAVLALGGCGEKADPVETAKEVISQNFKALAAQFKATGEDTMAFEHEGQHYALSLLDKRGQQGLCFVEEGARPREKVLVFAGEKVRITFKYIGNIEFNLID